ncbi:MAG: nucleoside deaminase [Rikenellaceae bacterium]|nr:nucleoside deaminase [Rikenellaceae bacterium]
MDKENVEFMKKALEIASGNASTQGGGPFGAVIVKDGKVVSAAGNTVTPDNDPTAHAEVNAIRNACKELKTFDLSGCVLYTSCEPCPMCLSASYWARIGRIYYAAGRDDAAKAGFSDAFIYDQFDLPVNERSLPAERIMEEEGLQPFELWLRNDNKRAY